MPGGCCWCCGTALEELVVGRVGHEGEKQHRHHDRQRPRVTLHRPAPLLPRCAPAWTRGWRWRLKVKCRTKRTTRWRWLRGLARREAWRRSPQRQPSWPGFPAMSLQPEKGVLADAFRDYHLATSSRAKDTAHVSLSWVGFSTLLIQQGLTREEAGTIMSWRHEVSAWRATKVWLRPGHPPQPRQRPPPAAP